MFGTDKWLERQNTIIEKQFAAMGRKLEELYRNESYLRWDGRRPDEPDFAFQRRCFSHAVKYIMTKYSVKQNKGLAR